MCKKRFQFCYSFKEFSYRWLFRWKHQGDYVAEWFKPRRSHTSFHGSWIKWHSNWSAIGKFSLWSNSISNGPVTKHSRWSAENWLNRSTNCIKTKNQIILRCFGYGEPNSICHCDWCWRLTESSALISKGRVINWKRKAIFVKTVENIH